jgi:hypothetical protein
VEDCFTNRARRIVSQTALTEAEEFQIQHFLNFYVTGALAIISSQSSQSFLRWRNCHDFENSEYNEPYGGLGESTTIGR